MEEGVVCKVVQTVFGLWFRLVQDLVYGFLKLVRGSKKGQIPPIRNKILLEPATRLAAKIRTGKLKSLDVVKACIERIGAVNGILNAVVEDRFPAAIEDAKAADNYVATSGKTPEELALEKPFLGVPFTTKDSVAIKGLSLAVGVIARKGFKASEDCVVVANLRASGAIPLCVTNVPELCFWGDTSNKLNGITNNPYDLTRIPGGSSGGEGTLITCAGSIFGIGNDIGGSVRLPAFCCGIFAHKPTRRVLINKGQYPSSYETELDNYNVTGPMCRYAADLIPMFKALGPKEVEKLKLDEKVEIKNLKVYYTEDYIDNPMTSRMDPELRDAVKKVVQHLESTFGIKAQKVSLPLLNSGWSIWMTKIFTAKIPAPLTDLATKEPGEFNIFKESFKWCMRTSEHTLHFLFMVSLGLIYAAPWMKNKAEKYKEMYNSLVTTFKEMLGQDGIFIIPTSATTAPFYEEQIFKLYNYTYTGVFSILGNPVTQCPMGLSSEGLPLGVQVVANHLNDRLTLAVAREIESQFGGWQSPAPIL